MSTPPDLTLDTPPIIREVPGGIFVPIPNDNNGIQPLNCGVLTPDHEFVEESTTWRDGRAFSLPPRELTSAEIEPLPGRFMFGGLLFGHFGHFLVESTARLWAYEALQDKIDGIVYVPKVQRRIDHVQNVYTPFMKLLGIEAPIHNIPSPAQADIAYVPQQGFGMFGMIEGLREYREFMRARMGRKIADDGAKRLYVSRSELPQERGGLLGETLIEEYLRGEGYEVFHPQKHDFATQLAAYKSADYIVSADGSPLHMAALVVKPTAKIAVIARRPNVAAQFELQFRAFCGIETLTIDALRDHWIPVNHARPSRLSYGEIDFDEVYRALKGGGLIRGDTPWPGMSDEARAEIMTVLEERQKIGFKLYQPKPV